MKIIITVNLSGILFFLCYILVKNFKRNISISWHYFMLKINILLFLLPLGCIKQLIAYLFMPYISTNESITYKGSDQIFISSQFGFYSNLKLQFETSITIIWLIVAITLFFKWFFDYIRFQRILVKNSESFIEQTLYTYLNKCKQQLNLKKKVRLLYIIGQEKAFTTGIIRPLIVLPRNIVHEKCYLELKHELVHIKNNDMYFNMLLRMIICLNWFNPLVYRLAKEQIRFSELVCDHKVIENLNKQEKIAYGHLIINSSRKDTNVKLYFSAFNNSKKIIKERIYYIMKYEKKKLGKPIIILSIMMIIISSIPAFAYQGSKKLNISGNISETDFSVFNADDNYSKFSTNDSFIAKTESIPFDSYFKATSGEIYSADSTDDNTYKNCIHTFVDGEYTVHEVQNDGSCTLKYYEAQRCTKCGHIVVGKLIKTITYPSCPH